MKTLSKLIVAATLNAAGISAAMAADTQPMPVFAPVAPFAMNDSHLSAVADHHKMIAEQQQGFIQAQATAFHNAMETQRKFMENMTQSSPLMPSAFAMPEFPASFDMPEMPAIPAAFEIPELPSDIASLDPQTRRIEMRKLMEERREAMRKQIQEQRDAAMQARETRRAQMMSQRSNPET